MKTGSDLDVFLNPDSVAVIGATERPDAWGSFIMLGLLSTKYNGRIYPVNRDGGKVYGLPAYPDISAVPGPVELVVVAIPGPFLEETVEACGRKGVRGLIIITAGFGETSEEGKTQQEKLARLARSYGTRIMGPNVSGTFNFLAGFNASTLDAKVIRATPVAAACQGGMAFYDLFSAGGARGLGVGKFIHTGNESDLTVTDFLEYFGRDPEIKAVIMYLETIRDGRRFLEVAREVTRVKPVVVYKAGRTSGSARAALSHTGALAGQREVFDGLFEQTGVLVSPSMEMLLPLSQALVERPVMRGRRVGLITMGGSWGVALSDALEETGLLLPEFSPELQKKLRSLNMPDRASTRNPVDFGASGQFLSAELPVALGREILLSGEADALVVHGIGRPGLRTQDTPQEARIFMEVERRQTLGLCELEKETGLPVLIGSHYTPWECQVVKELTQEGIMVYNRLADLAQVLSLMCKHHQNRSRRGL